MPVVLVPFAAVALAGGWLKVVILVLGLLLWNRYAEVIRIDTMQVPNHDFILAAQGVGCSSLRIILAEIMFNILNNLVVANLEINLWASACDKRAGRAHQRWHLCLRRPHEYGCPFFHGTDPVLRSGGVRMAVATHNLQVYDRQVFKSRGIDPAACDVLAVKSWQHFRAAFQPISRQVFLVDSGCLVSMDLKRFPYQKVRRPVYPLDLD